MWLRSTDEADDDYFDDEDVEEQEEQGTMSGDVNEFEMLNEIFEDEIAKAPELSIFFNGILTSKIETIRELEHEKRDLTNRLAISNHNLEDRDNELERSRNSCESLRRDLNKERDSISPHRIVNFVWWLVGFAIQLATIFVIFKLNFESRNH